MNVRQAHKDDIARLRDFQVAMAMESEGLVLDPSTVQRGIEIFLQKPHEGVYYVITHADIPVACAMVQYEWSDWRAKRVLWLHSVYVEPEFRRRGCFRLLYVHLQNQVQDQADLAGIRLYVDKKNIQAEDTYRRLGMTDEHYNLFEWLKTEG